MRDIQRLLRFMRPYRRLAVLALTTLTMLVALDLLIPRLIQRIIDQGIHAHDRAVIVQTAVMMLGISAMSAVIAIASNVFSVRVGEGVARDLREALFARVQRFSFGNLDRQKTGDLMVRLTSDVSAMKMLAQISLRIGTRAPLMMFGSMVLMFTTSPRLAMTMLPLLVVTSVIIGFFVVRMEPLFRRVQQKLDGLNEVLQENIAGVRLVKALVRADFEGERFEAKNEVLMASSISVMKFMSLMTPLLTMCINVGVVIVIWTGGLLTVRGELSLGQIVAFTNYLFMTMAPLLMMSMLSNVWAAGLASSRRMDEILEGAPDVVDSRLAVPLVLASPPRVLLENVSFTYRGDGNEPVLCGVTLIVEPGETVAIVGSTGAGKSTLVSLIPRLYDVSSGCVKVGGQDVREVTQDSLLAAVQLVPQETVLFSGTVRDNIRYGRPDATELEVVSAATAAQAHGFIMKLEGGYESRVEQRGSNLSGGQKQRLAIARALLVKPKLLIVDDSTSAVDIETETKIQDALASEKGSRTTIVVAQRISTVLNADRVVVLDKGRVVAEGTHRELMSSSAVYREIYDSQLGAWAIS